MTEREDRSEHANSFALFREGQVYWFTLVQSRANHQRARKKKKSSKKVAIMKKKVAIAYNKYISIKKESKKINKWVYKLQAR